MSKPFNEKVQNHPDGTKEIWRDIFGFEGTHRVSNRGRVKSITRVVKGGR